MNADRRSNRRSDVRSDLRVVLRSLGCFGIRAEAQRLVWKRMRSGDRPGLQNRRAAGFPVAGGFDPHSLPPFIFSKLASLKMLSQTEIAKCVLAKRDKNVINQKRQEAAMHTFY
jgi:hypothetical protein